MHTPTSHRLFFVVLALGLSVIAYSQTRRDDFNAASVVVTDMHLSPLPDGGCAASWCGNVTSADGGTELRACTDVIELKSTVTQNRCAGLATAGVSRLQRIMRFDVDAGAP